ncbi:hypothetical protein DYB37_004415 [Aphanomyces astaci]|uniref:tRNA (guanine(46)-N(7))-methyltransferase n=1 Tax=Aphanomyces astaci TaxID=112090 RepID=A0A3R7CAF8_APHAT|nr:hypothetical protein DYB37_004415 [Aphanomyces astaci]
MAGHKRTADGEMAAATTESEIVGMPQKKFYRSRAHCNPLSHNDSFDYPLNPADMNWSTHFPKLENPYVLHFVIIPDLGCFRKVDILDIGCGFGGLTIALAGLFPDKTTLAMEIRPKVTEYVRLRIEALRQENASTNQSADPCVAAMTEETEEGKKVARSGGNKYIAVYRRVSDAHVQATASTLF